MLNPQFWFQPATPPPPPLHPLEGDGQECSRAPRRVLVVDDEHLIADTLSAILEDSGFSASAVYSAEEAIDVARELQPDIVISDVLMPKMSGVELGIHLRKELPQARVILFSGQAATSELMRKAQADGYVFELFPKPIHPEELIAKLQALQ